MGKYVCSGCTVYSTDNRTEFLMHRAFCNGRVNWRGNGAWIGTLILALIVSLLTAQNAQAAPDGRYPKPRPDGSTCVDIAGGIQGMEKIKNAAGTTYFTDSHNIDSPIKLPANVSVAMWDADGTPYTVLQFLEDNTVVFSENILTANADVSDPPPTAWSESYPVTGIPNRIKVTLPADHKSTTVCILVAEDTTPETPVPTPPSPTPPVGTPPSPTPPAPTPIPQRSDLSIRLNVSTDSPLEPTGINPGPEPIGPARYDGTIYARVGSEMSITVTVHNNGPDRVENAVVVITGTNPYTHEIGTLAARMDAIFVYTAKVQEGANVDIAEARSSTPDDAPTNNFDTIVLNGYRCVAGQSMIGDGATDFNFCAIASHWVYLSLITR